MEVQEVPSTRTSSKPFSESKKRRLEKLGKYKNLKISYESITTHDVANSIDNMKVKDFE